MRKWSQIALTEWRYWNSTCYNYASANIMLSLLSLPYLTQHIHLLLFIYVKIRAKLNWLNDDIEIPLAKWPGKYYAFVTIFTVYHQCLYLLLSFYLFTRGYGAKLYWLNDNIEIPLAKWPLKLYSCYYCYHILHDVYIYSCRFNYWLEFLLLLLDPKQEAACLTLARYRPKTTRI